MASAQALSQERGLRAFTHAGWAKQHEPMRLLLDYRLNLASRVATFEPGCSVGCFSHKARFANCSRLAGSRIRQFGEMQVTKSQRLDQDALGDLRAEGQPGVTDQANDVGLGGEQSHDLVFAESKLPEAASNVGGGTKLFNADGYAGFDAVERAEGVFTSGWCLTGCGRGLVLHTVKI